MATKSSKRKTAVKKLSSGKRIQDVKPLLNPQPLPPGRIPIS
jgi:hypothetical protein